MMGMMGVGCAIPTKCHGLDPSAGYAARLALSPHSPCAALPSAQHAAGSVKLCWVVRAVSGAAGHPNLSSHWHQVPHAPKVQGLSLPGVEAELQSAGLLQDATPGSLPSCQLGTEPLLPASPATATEVAVPRATAARRSGGV